MKTLIHCTLFIFLTPLFISCLSDSQPNNEEIVLIRVINSTGETNCTEGVSLKFGFKFNRPDNFFDGGTIINEKTEGSMNLSVWDGTDVEVEIRRLDNDSLLASDRVQILLESRDVNFEDEIRTITYCDGEEISFDFF